MTYYIPKLELQSRIPQWEIILSQMLIHDLRNPLLFLLNPYYTPIYNLYSLSYTLWHRIVINPINTDIQIQLQSTIRSNSLNYLTRYIGVKSKHSILSRKSTHYSIKLGYSSLTSTRTTTTLITKLGTIGYQCQYYF